MGDYKHLNQEGLDILVEEIRKRVPFYATCSTAAATAAKVINNLNGFALRIGAVVKVKFTYSNTVANPTLNINGTGAKPIKRYGTTAPGTSAAASWQANGVVELVYDGTNWMMLNGPDNNTTYSNASLGQGYGTCPTAEDTAAKVVTLASYGLTVGGIVSVKFTYAVPADATMNINSKGAKPIFYKGAAIKAGVIKAGDVGVFQYDGTNYHLLAIDGAATATPSAASIANMVYPVGSIYMSVVSTSPETLFGGTWERLKGRFLLGAEDSGDYASGKTGGAASQSYTPAGTVGSHTLTTDEIPSHTHTFTGSSATTGKQSAGHTHTTTTGNQSASHTHTGTSGGQSATHTHTGGAHTHPVDLGTHTDTIKRYNTSQKVGFWAASINSGTGWDILSVGATASGKTADLQVVGNTGSGGAVATGGASVGHTHTTTTGNQSASHTHTGTSGGISADHTHTVTAKGSNSNTGGGKGHNHGFTGTEATIATMPPFLSVYMWKRTA